MLDLIGYGRNSYNKLVKMLNTKVLYGMHRAYELTHAWEGHIKLIQHIAGHVIRKFYNGYTQNAAERFFGYFHFVHGEEPENNNNHNNNKNNNTYVYFKIRDFGD